MLWPCRVRRDSHAQLGKAGAGTLWRRVMHAGEAAERTRDDVTFTQVPAVTPHSFIRGITRVLRRGKQAVQAEIDLIATTHNLLKLHRHTALPAG